MSYDSAGALKVLQDGLAVDKPNRFKEADTLVGLQSIELIASLTLCTSSHSSWHGPCYHNASIRNLVKRS